jgi:trehalose/maltose transport system substrate-binding protein
VFLDPIGRAGLLNRMLIQNFSIDTGIPVQIISNTEGSTDRLAKSTQILASRTSGIDLLVIDCTWAPILQEYLEDLSPLLGAESEDYFPQLIRQNTVQGKLVGVPLFVDLGLMYYRKDLLEKYGFRHPPATWYEMKEMARVIQKGERAAGNAEFWGLSMALSPQEGLTCTALEWQASTGGGNIVTDGGRVTVNNGATLEALSMAREWIGQLASPESLTMDIEGSRLQFQAGNAAFMRNWVYAWEVLNDSTSPVQGKVGVTQIPGGPGGSRSVLGGWQLAIPTTSTRKEAAWQLARHLVSERSQRIRAMEGGFPPTRPKLYDDPKLREKQPHLIMIGEAIGTAIMRPSRGTRAKYGEISAIYYSGVSDVLSGRSGPSDSLGAMELKMRRALER